MDAMTNLKANLQGPHVTVAPQPAPHRSCHRAMGLSDDEIVQLFVAAVTRPERKAERVRYADI